MLIPLLLLSQGKAMGQVTGVTAGSVVSCAGAVTIPVNVTQMNGVNAISLTLGFDSNKLIYNGYQAVNPALSAGMLVVNGTGNRVFFSWAGTVPVSVTSGVLVELLFTTLGQTSQLQWITTSGQCEFSNSVGQPLQAQYTDGSITAPGPVPLITQEPSSFSVIEGVNKILSVVTTGSTSHQWQVSQNNGSSWGNIVSGMGYSGFQSASLTITAPALSMNGYRYRCIVTGACPPADTSNAATMTVLAKVTITAHNRNSCADTLSIPVSVKGFVNIGALSLILNHDSTRAKYLDYQKINPFLSSGNLLINASGGKVYISWAGTTPVNLPENDTLIELRFLYTGLNTNLTWQTTGIGSEVADINANPLPVTYVNSSLTSPGLPPVITSQPANKSVYTGQSAQFFVNVTTSTTRQWQVSTNGGASWSNLLNNQTYSGTTTTSLTVSNVQLLMDQYRYRCVITGLCPPADTSQSALLSVSIQPPIIITSIPSMQLCGQLISVPVVVQNFQNVGAASLVLNYNTNILTFSGISQLHPNLTAGIVSANAAGGKIYFSWASVTPGNIGNDTLVYFDFAASGGSAAFSWNTQTSGNCEYSDLNAQIFLSQFVNGTITIDTSNIPVNFVMQDTLFCSN